MQILGKIWHHDVKGPFATSSIHYANRYQCSFRESKSRLNYLTCMKHKSDVYESTQLWIKQYIIPLRATRPDLGPIFVVSDMGEFNKEQIRDELLAPNGIFSVTTCPYVPAHNGVVERLWRTLSDITICQLLASNLPESFWEESAKFYFGIAPPISHFRIFGSVCYVKDILAPKQPRAKSFRGIFVGYEDRQQVGYRIYLPEQKHFIVNYHVTFSNADDIFSSIQQANLNDRQVNSLMKSMSHEIKEVPLESSPTHKVNQVAQSTGHAYQSELFIAQEDLIIYVTAMDKADVICLEPVSPADTLPTPGCEANCEGYSSVLDVTANSPKDKANREGNCTDVSSTGSYLKDTVPLTITMVDIREEKGLPYVPIPMMISESDPRIEKLANNVTFPKISESFLYQIDHSTGKEEYELKIREKSKERYLIDSQTGNAAIGYALSARTDIIDVKTPKTFNQAMKSSDSAQWKTAIEAELQSMRDNNVWKPAILPEDRKLVTTKWVFRPKYDIHGVIVKYKARLVARGFEQVYGKDFDETYSPVTRLSSLRLLFALATQFDLDLQQMDVETAFLNANLQEEVYIEVPQGVQIEMPNNCFRLNKALYGLKQSPRAWYEDINKTLRTQGYKCMQNENCLFVKHSPASITIIALYVDDLIIAGKSSDVNQTKDFLKSRYTMKDLGF
eukprot:gene18407-18677_t